MKRPIESSSNILRMLFHFLFECHHSEMSRVFTIKHRTYQVCLECGKEVDYSLSLMHSLPSNASDNAYASNNARRVAWPARGMRLESGHCGGYHTKGWKNATYGG
jgi:hypothetical protein